jgi:hypothetical protein
MTYARDERAFPRRKKRLIVPRDVRIFGAPGRRLDRRAATCRGFDWAYENVGRDLSSVPSAAATTCTAFVIPCPLLPVHAGESGNASGAKASVRRTRGRSSAKSAVRDHGAPMPSMPLYFVGDAA